jgi:hypothetical protein
MPMRRSIGPRHWGEIACRSGRVKDGGAGEIALNFQSLAVFHIISRRAKNTQEKREAGYIYSYTTVWDL